MYLVCNGTLYLSSKIMNAENILSGLENDLTDFKRMMYEVSIESGVLNIDICGSEKSDMSFVDRICAWAKRHAVDVYGRISYSGDYDGAYIVKNCLCTDVDASDLWKYDASDEELLEVCRQRGLV